MSQLTASKILERLALGHLSNLTLVDNKNAPDEIKAKYVPSVLMYLNQALRDIFTKFVLIQKEIVINADQTITHYFLRWEFAQTNTASTQTIKYLDDTATEDFAGNVVKILEVYDDFGKELFMNRKDEPLSVFTPQFDCLQITANHETDNFYVIFQSLHPEATAPFGDGDNAADPDTVLNLPPSLEDPLLLLIASKVYSALNSDKNVMRGLQFSQQYEMALLENEVKDLASTSQGSANSRLDRAGFV